MWFLLLLATLAFGQVDKSNPFGMTRGTVLATTRFKCPFEFDLELFINKGNQPRYWRSILLYGENPSGRRGLGLWLFPGSTRLHVRTSTNRNGNDGVNTAALPQNSWVSLRVLVECRKVSVSVNGKMYTRNFGRAIWRGQGVQKVWGCSKSYHCVKGRIRGFSAFNNLPPVFSRCAKLKIMAAAKMSGLKSEMKATKKAIPQHQASEKINTRNCLDLKEIIALCNKLKAIAKKTVTALLDLIAKLRKECQQGIKTAQKNTVKATGRLKQAQKQLDQLKKNKVKCECTALKRRHGRVISKKQQQISDYKKMRPSYNREISKAQNQIKLAHTTKAKANKLEDALRSLSKMFDKESSVLDAQRKKLSDIKGKQSHSVFSKAVDIIDDQNKCAKDGKRRTDKLLAMLTKLKKMIDDQVTRLRKGVKDNQKKIADGDKKIKDDKAYIKKYKKQIEDCFKRLKKMQEAFADLYADETLMQIIDDLNYFDDLESMELWSQNVKLEDFEKDFNQGMDMELGADASVQEVKVEETAAETAEVPVEARVESEESVAAAQSVSYGLIGGAGVLTSGIFYYAYQRRNSA